MTTHKKKITYPTSLFDIPTYKVVEWARMPIEQQTSLRVVLTHFTALTDDEVQRMDVTSAETIFNGITSTLARQEYPLQTIITVNGQRFGLIPDMDEMTFGEYIDLSTYMDDPETFSKAMAVAYRRVTNSKIIAGRERYAIEPYHGTNRDDVEMWDKQPIAFPLGLRAFFLRLGDQLLITTKNSTPDKSAQTNHRKQWSGQPK